MTSQTSEAMPVMAKHCIKTERTFLVRTQAAVKEGQAGEGHKGQGP